MDINQLSASTEAASGWRPHPLGSFQGTVSEVKKETVKGTPVWKICVATSQGIGEASVWGFSQADLTQAAQDPAHKDKLIKSIGRAKRLVADLGVATDATLAQAGWDQGHGCVTSYFGQVIIGAKCRLVVQQDQRDPKKKMTFINAYTNMPDEIKTTPPAAPGMMAGAPPEVAAAFPSAGHPNGQFPPAQGFAQPPAGGSGIPNF